MLLLFLLLVLWGGEGRACPAFALQSISTPQAAYFTKANTYEFAFPCLSGNGTSRVIHFTPPVSGSYFAKVESLVDDDGDAALSLVSNLCDDNKSSIVACAVSSPTLGVGFDSVYLSQGELYSFLLLTPASDKRNLLTVFLLPPASANNSTANDCLSNQAASLPQTIALSARHAQVMSTQCNGGGVAGKQALYASFTAQQPGNYYVRVANSPSDLMMEIRAASCAATVGGGGALACNDDLQSVRSTGFNSLALKANTTYVVLVTAMGTAKAILGTRALDVGYCGNACGRFDEENENASGGEEASLLGLIIPVATLGLVCAITLALWARQRSASTSTVVVADLHKSSLADSQTPVVTDRRDNDDDHDSITSNSEAVV